MLTLSLKHKVIHNAMKISQYTLKIQHHFLIIFLLLIKKVNTSYIEWNINYFLKVLLQVTMNET